VGCYRDTEDRAIPTLEGTDPILDGDYKSRQNAIAKCADAARKKVSTCLQFKMVGGAQPALQQKRLSTNMAKATIARKTAKEAVGQTTFTLFEVGRLYIYHYVVAKCINAITLHHISGIKCFNKTHTNTHTNNTKIALKTMS
jgi:hypothetical protein